MTSCMSRNTPAGSCQDSDGNSRNMTLNATECTLCSDHVDCHSCVEVIVRYFYFRRGGALLVEVTGRVLNLTICT